MWERLSGRALRAVAVVCALSGAALSAGVARGANGGAGMPSWLRAKSGAPVMVYEPGSKAPSPMVVMLHGMCDVPENECPFFTGAAADVGFLVCPRGNLKCDGGGVQFGGLPSAKAETLFGAMASVREAYGERVDESSGDTLVGFSGGAFAAVELVTREPGRFSSLVLIGASVSPDARSLRQAGVQRVVMAAGDLDQARPTMVRAARALDRAGLPARFISLGRVGHTFPADMDAKMREAIAWARAGGTGA